MKKYAEAPWYWYAMLLALSFFAGAGWFPYLRLTLNSFVRYRVDRGAQRSNNAPLVVIYSRSDPRDFHHGTRASNAATVTKIAADIASGCFSRSLHCSLRAWAMESLRTS